mmetsp:Transcript_28192/g.42651  ORF Transcript_28192/g.42651 Transcript_28192/m.42651 type:complete len:467 (+) Transcript_28192:109-1509(+)|eukprot:CAMPEP_0178925562 /NCGR_PEP_ID=MMETSP0786-20121207/17987_1 /TAXON_ID=186022 /ORGANISM="Thalassionema frauenfeldii, Strain CCMP 1798" /LENGTH=466 /DNA_ID=CAMNT_0020600469 /DNA_START=39 /DNA_END=1439 /DNA_ORIENTATION=+
MSFKTSTQLHLDNKTRGFGYFGVAPPIGVSQYEQITKLVDIEIHNGRENNDLTLDDASFELVECPTKLSTKDFYKMKEENDEVLKKQYEDEVSNFIKAKLGCDKVVCFHSQIRTDSTKGKSSKVVQPYAVGGPHTDSSAVSGDEAAYWALQESESGGNDGGEEKPATYKRYLYLNLWRNISEDPIQDYPLAMLDERTTVKPDDYLARDLFLPGNNHLVQYGLNARHAKQHKWYYFPKMPKSEGILFKQIDSDWTKTGRTCFHMAVKDPNAPKDAKPRESIELRVMCYWKEADIDSFPSADIIKKKQAQSNSSGSSALGLHNATTVQLFGALIMRVPILGTLLNNAMQNQLVAIIFSVFNSCFQDFPPYSGDPQDYVGPITQAMRYFKSWPSFARKGMEGQIKGKTVGDAAKVMATMLVDDSTGNFKTKKFSKEDKKTIVEACVTNEQFLAAINDQLGELLADQDGK